MSESPFEIPQSVRDVAEQNMKQAHAAYEQVTDFVSKTMSLWAGAVPESPLAAGFREVQARAMEFAKDNAESAFAFAGKICNAHSPQEVLAFQAEFTQDRMKAFLAHTQELYRLIGEALRKMQHS